MINEESVIDAFKKVKEDISSLKEEIEVLKMQLIQEKLERERLQIGLATDIIQEIKKDDSPKERLIKTNKKIKPKEETAKIEIIRDEDTLTDFKIEENLDEDSDELY